MSAPFVTVNEGFIWFFPLYAPTWLQNMFTMGSWFWTHFAMLYSDILANDIYSPWVFEHYTGSAMWAYLSHYFWIVLVCQLVTRPFKLNLFSAIAVNFFGSLLLTYFSYFLLLKLFSKGKKGGPAKQKKQEEMKLKV